MIFNIETKELKLIVEAKDKNEAIKKFFETIIKENKLNKVGQIGIIKGKTEAENVPFRIVPALYYLGILSKEDALANIKLAIGSDVSEEELNKMVENDKKFVKDIKDELK
jgi:hypothetical protein